MTTEYERGYVDGHKEGLETASRHGDIERKTLIYWLLRAYQSGHREGWEPSPSTDETMDGICSALANRGYDPNLSLAAKKLLEKGLK